MVRDILRATGRSIACALPSRSRECVRRSEETFRTPAPSEYTSERDSAGTVYPGNSSNRSLHLHRHCRCGDHGRPAWQLPGRTNRECSVGIKLDVLVPPDTHDNLRCFLLKPHLVCLEARRTKQLHVRRPGEVWRAIQG